MLRLITSFACAIAAVILPGDATAQVGTGREQAWSGPYRDPPWGQANVPDWGTYSGAVGRGGWQFNRQLQPSEPTGAVAEPNGSSLTFGNPRTGATLFQPQDTRLRGRDRP